jgi:hypothetical protein
MDWKEAGLITESNSPWDSPIVMVPKPNGAWRIACDYRPLNKRTVPDRYPLTNIDDAFSVLGGTCFSPQLTSKVDFSKYMYHSQRKQNQKKPLLHTNDFTSSTAFHLEFETRQPTSAESLILF